MSLSQCHYETVPLCHWCAAHDREAPHTASAVGEGLVQAANALLPTIPPLGEKPNAMNPSEVPAKRMVAVTLEVEGSADLEAVEAVSVEAFHMMVNPPSRSLAENKRKENTEGKGGKPRRRAV